MTPRRSCRLSRFFLVVCELLVCLAPLALADLKLTEIAQVPPGFTTNDYVSDKVYDGFLVFCPEYEDGEEKKIHGPRIYHADGSVYWAGDEWRWRCMSARLQTWKEQRVLTFWYDNGNRPYGAILDTNYNEIKQVRPVGGSEFDLHEFRITSSNETVLMILMKTVGADLSSIGGSRHGMVYSPFIQEVDIETGKLVWEWSAAEHLIFSGSFQHFGGGVYGYAHCNAVYKDEDGNFLMSFRFYSMIIKVDGKTKDIIWRLGGKNSDFSFNNGSTFIGQHDPQWVPGTHQTELTLFDNDCDDLGTLGPWGTARGIWVRLDYDKMTVTLVREYLPPERKRADIEGGMEILPNGNVLVAHGSSGWVLEYTHDGELVFHGQTHQVYRAYKYPKDFWPGNGLPNPIESNDYVDVDDDVSMVFDSGHGQCEGLLSFLGLCLSS